MASPVEAQLVLADAAQSDSQTGKVHMLGAGWSLTSSPTTHAVVVLLKVPWDRTNEKLPLTLDLLNADGHPVQLAGPTGTPVALHAGAAVEVGRPPGIAAGSMLDASFVLNVTPLPLMPARYEWRLEIDGRSYSAPFTVVG